MNKKNATPKSSTQHRDNTNSECQPCKLNTGELDQLLSKLPQSAKQARRTVTYVADHPDAPTVRVNVAAAVGNISDVAVKYNPLLIPHGYLLACHKPPAPIPNRFGERSGMHLWGLYRVKGGANDA